MSLSDPIADMLTRIRNAVRIHARQVNVKASKICEGIAAVLKTEGYIEGFDRIDDEKQGILRINLKYSPEGQPIIGQLDRISKPGRRIYRPVDKIPHILNGMGIAVISTSKGVMSDKKCREAKVGGEVICTVS